MKSIKKIYLIGLGVIILATMDVAACTTAVISGKATPDGRPLLWKHRDTWAVKNKIVQFFDGTYACAGLVNSVDSANKSIWIGYNETGFGIMNSASYNLNNDTLKQTGLEGRLMKDALQNCATVDEFEAFLSGLEKPVRLEANFGVIDAGGNAAFFELSNYTYRKYDANDPEIAPEGYIIRTNYSFSGTLGVGGGYIRYITATREFQDAYEMNNLTYQTIIQKVSRNLTHGLTNTDLNKYLVYPERTQTMVYFKDFIPRSGSSSSCIVQGVKPGENATLSTMWSVVGFPLTSVVTPVWINKDVELPSAVKYDEEIQDSPICNFALTLKDSVYSYKQGGHANYYIDINRVINASQTGYTQVLKPLEERIIERSEQLYAKWRKNGSIEQNELKQLYQWIDQEIFTTYKKQFNLSLDHPETRYHAGVYSGGGASAICILETLESMKIDSGFQVSRISPVDIQNGKLDSLDVLIFPGGSGSMEYLSLGQSGAQKVHEFARKKGKGLVGICAGGFLFATTEGYPSLKLLNAKTIRDHYDRGRGLIAFDLNEKGQEIFPELAHLDTLFLQYYDGPIFELLQNTPPEVLGSIISDIATGKDDPHNVTPGKPSFLSASYGEGNLIVTTGHPESTPGMRWMVPRMARYVIHAPLIGYDNSIIRPEINDREILYYPDIIGLERSSRWGLYSDNDSMVLASLSNLHSIRSRPSIRWSMGLLRHHSASIRIAAAHYLLDTEYTYAIPELIAAVRNEKEPEVQSDLEEVIYQLSQLTD